MKRLFTAANMLDGAQIEVLQGLLEEIDIRCMVRNEFLSGAEGLIPVSETRPELWILNDADYPRARATLDNWQVRRSPIEDPWVCRNCGEELEGQFTSCWHCGSDRPRDLTGVNNFES